MTLEQAMLLASGKEQSEVITVGDVVDVMVARNRRIAAARAAQTWRVPFRFDGKTRGKRDTSLRSRANRRKSCRGRT